MNMVDYNNLRMITSTNQLEEWEYES